jgi:hypothetical protein
MDQAGGLIKSAEVLPFAQHAQLDVRLASHGFIARALCSTSERITPKSSRRSVRDRDHRDSLRGGCRQDGL